MSEMRLARGSVVVTTQPKPYHHLRRCYAPCAPPEPAREEPSPAQKEVNPAQGLEYSVEDTPKSSGGLGMIDMSGVRGDDEPDEEADSLRDGDPSGLLC